MLLLLRAIIFLIIFIAPDSLHADAGEVQDYVDLVDAIRNGALKRHELNLKFREKMRKEGKIPPAVNRSDIVYNINGRIREDYFYFDQTLLFRGHLDDSYRYYRSKVELRATGVVGMKTFGEPAATFGIQFTNYVFWQANTVYENIVQTQTYLEGLDRSSTGDNHTHDTIVPLVYMEAGVVAVHFGTIFQFLKKAQQELNLRAGFFPYWLGRGLSLGTHNDMCLTWGGWAGYGNNYRFPVMPPAVLLQHRFSKNCSWEFYYNKWRAYSSLPTTQNLPGIQADIFISRLDGRRPARGIDQDRDTWALRFDFTKKHEKYGKLYVQPYFSYTRAPDLNVEFIVDSKAKLGTVGFMADYKYKNWQGNIECAGQFGHQHMHCIDRNVIMLKRDKTTGNVREVYSHIFVDAPLSLRDTFPNGTYPADNAPVRRIDGSLPYGQQDLINLVNLPANRPNGIMTSTKKCKVPCLSREEILSFNGKQLVDANGDPVQVDFNDGAGPQNIYNSNFFGNARFRPAYNLKYRGFMALADLAYTTDDHQFKVAGAAGYIGGDRFPFNEEHDKPFKAFIAQRGAYGGLHVEPIFMFERLILARPLGISYRQLVGRTHFRDYTNLQFIGASLKWFPLQNRNKFMIMPNVTAFWQVADVRKWDKNGVFPDPAKEAQINLIRTGSLQFCGWETTCPASKFLGVETNIIIEYFVIPQCKMYFKGYIFFPGQCYKDMEGMPNEFGLRDNKNRAVTAYTQLHEIATGFYTGLDFKF